MKRLLRPLLNALTVASSLLCLLVACLWIRGCWIGDSLLISYAYGTPAGPSTGLTAQAWSSHGGMRLFLQLTRSTITPRANFPFPAPETPFRHGWFVSRSTYGGQYYPVDEFAHIPPHAGFQWVPQRTASAGLSTWENSLTLPAWLLVLLFALLPARSAIAFTRRRRQRARPEPPHCLTCGYNLTANLTGTCPECGTPLPKTAHDTIPT